MMVFKSLTIFFSLFILFFLIDENQSKILSRIPSDDDIQLISFAFQSLTKSIGNSFEIDQIKLRRLNSSIDEKRSRQIWTIEFQLKISSNEFYQCPISIYIDVQQNLRALLRSIICLRFDSIPSDTIRLIPYPLRIDEEISIDQTIGFDLEESEQFDRNLFENFEKIYQKVYSNEKQRTTKFEIFKENLNEIERLNNEDDGTAYYGITQFTDLTQNEFSSLYLNSDLQSSLKLNSNLFSSSSSSSFDPKKVSPDNFDWRHFNAVTPVKNQGQCGSCWAFSVTGNIEGIWKIHSGDLISLSEQELIDCDQIDEGCNGGLMTNAFDQIIQMKGLMSEDDYQYVGKQHPQCQLDTKKIQVQINSYLNISSNENDMATWLAQNGPISIGLNANMMQFYFRGVAHPHRTFCNPQGINHGVLIVGYGIEQKGSKTIPFWIIKNSWGSHWGEQGYYRLYRGDGSCGVNLMCSSAQIDGNQ